MPRKFDFEGQRDLITKLPQDWGNWLLEGTNKTVCTPGPRRKEQWPCKRLSQSCLWVSRSLQQRRGSTVVCHEVKGTEYNSPGISTFEGDCQLPLLLLLFGLRPNYRKGTQPHLSTEKWFKDLLIMVPPTRARTRFPHKQFLSSGSFHKPLILIHQRAGRLETTIIGN